MFITYQFLFRNILQHRKIYNQTKNLYIILLTNLFK